MLGISWSNVADSVIDVVDLFDEESRRGAISKSHVADLSGLGRDSDGDEVLLGLP